LLSGRAAAQVLTCCSTALQANRSSAPACRIFSFLQELVGFGLSSPSTAGEIHFAECLFRQEGPYFRHIKSIGGALKFINQTKKASPPHS
jgi:hypothetical protein